MNATSVRAAGTRRVTARSLPAHLIAVLAGLLFAALVELAVAFTGPVAAADPITTYDSVASIYDRSTLSSAQNLSTVHGGSLQ